MRVGQGNHKSGKVTHKDTYDTEKEEVSGSDTVKKKEIQKT